MIELGAASDPQQHRAQWQCPLGSKCCWVLLPSLLLWKTAPCCCHHHFSPQLFSRSVKEKLRRGVSSPTARAALMKRLRSAEFDLFLKRAPRCLYPPSHSTAPSLLSHHPTPVPWLCCAQSSCPDALGLGMLLHSSSREQPGAPSAFLTDLCAIPVPPSSRCVPLGSLVFSPRLLPCY